MHIILESTIFTQDPDLQFAEKRHVEKGLLRELHRRYRVLEYSPPDLQEYYLLKTKHEIDRKNLWFWLQRLEVFDKAQIALVEGANKVNIDFFGNNKQFVLNEIIKRHVD